MTQKELLLKDLCARVPYHPKGHVVNACNGAECDEWLTCASFPMFTSVTNNCRLYLRPMSSMTEEEKKELGRISCEGNIEHKYGIFHKSQDYLNSIHIDYRELIEKGLALEAPKDMYK